MNCKNMKKISLVATKDINNKPNMAQACLNKSCKDKYCINKINSSTICDYINCR